MTRSHLANGRFEHDLDNWTASSASYSAGDGDDHYGVAVLGASGGYIEQTFNVSRLRAYSLHVSAKPISGTLSADELVARIQDGDGNTVVSLSLESGTSGVWQENTDTVGLAPGTTYTLRLTNTSALSVRIDDVWLWHVPVTRAGVAARAHSKLGRLASDRSFVTHASADGAEGDYTYAIDAALRGLGALDMETGQPDIRWLEPATVQAAIDATVQQMLEQLQLDYATEVDVSLGPRRESYSQKSKAVGDILSGKAGGGAGRIIIRKLHHEHGV